MSSASAQNCTSTCRPFPPSPCFSYLTLNACWMNGNQVIIGRNASLISGVGLRQSRALKRIPVTCPSCGTLNVGPALLGHRDKAWWGKDSMKKIQMGWGGGEGWWEEEEDDDDDELEWRSMKIFEVTSLWQVFQDNPTIGDIMWHHRGLFCSGKMVSNKCHQVTVASHANLLVFRLRNIGVDKASTASAGTQIEQNREVLWHTPHGVIICAEYSAIVDLRRYKYTKVGLWNLGTVYIYIYLYI
jgi:hypothetical protein